jgi:protein-disulfide isomerase
MASSIRRLSPLVAAAGIVFFLGAPSWVGAQGAQKAREISIGDDPSKKEGSPGLVLVEMSDFQCPYCSQAALALLPQVNEKFVRTGKVELVFVDLPLEMHPHAFKAAEAAACAGEQKKFWDMHDVLFANQRALAPEQLPGYAEKLGLDAAAFQKCLADGTQAAGVREDMSAASALGIASTPSFLLGRRIPESDRLEILEVIKGLPPYEYLEGRLNALLAPPKPSK